MTYTEENLINGTNKVSDINKNTLGMLKNYCSLKVAPEFALLVNGSWGCGKSHLVKEFIDEFEENNKETKFLNVSLYGINDVSDIEAKIFEQLNPTMHKILSNKKVMFATRVAKGFLKGIFKFDANGDNKDDVTISAGVPDINLQDYLTDTSNCILVFDDLERCRMELDHILGYINYFVENDGYKVIIIADETKLLKRKNSQKQSYINVKEKLIGKTVVVHSDFDTIFNKFIGDFIENKSLCCLLEKNIKPMSTIFYQSGYNNFRSVRKTLIEITRFYELIDEDLKDNIELMSDLVQLFLLFSLEIYSGEIEAHELNKYLGHDFTKADNEEDKIEKKFKVINAKYTIDIDNTRITPKEWQTWFLQGNLDSITLNKTLRFYLKISHDISDDLFKLCDFYSLTNADFTKLESSVWQAFVNEEITITNEIYKLVKLYLFFSKWGLTRLKDTEIMNRARDLVSSLASAKNLNLDQLSNQSVFIVKKHDWDGEELPEFRKYLDDKINEQFNSISKSKLPTVIRAMKENVHYFHDLMIDVTNKESFVDTPILNQIDRNEFVQMLIKLSNRDKKTVFITLQSRYRKEKSESLDDEREWMLDVLNYINQESLDLESFDYFVLKQLAESLREYVDIKNQSKD
jgi:hypothetical protein